MGSVDEDWLVIDVSTICCTLSDRRRELLDLRPPHHQPGVWLGAIVENGHFVYEHLGWKIRR